MIFLEVLIEIIGEIFIGLLADLFFYFKSKKNREERKKAKALHKKIPARNTWTFLFQGLTALIIGYIVYRIFIN